MTRSALSHPLRAALAGLLLIFFTSHCDREKNNPPPDVETCRLTRLDADTLVTDYDYFYDAQNRIVRMESSNDWYTEFLYGTGEVVGRIYRPDGTLDDLLEFILNAEGNIIALRELNGDEYEIGYDSEGYLETFTETYANGGFYTEEYLVIDGNILSIRRTDNHGTVSLWVYEYDPDTEDKGGYFHPYNKELYGFAIVPLPIGRSSKNLAAKMTYFVDGSIVSTTTYDYEFTPEDYVSTLTAVLGGDTATVRYDYECR